MRLLLLLIISVNAFANDVIGDWHGQLDIQGMKLRISFHVKHDGEKYSSTMDSPDQGAMGIPTTTTFNEQTLSISLKNIGAEFSGKLQDKSQFPTHRKAGTSHCHHFDAL